MRTNARDKESQIQNDQQRAFGLIQTQTWASGTV